jgi:integrase
MAPEMQRHKIQKGHLFRKHGSWHVEYYQEVPGANGVPSWRKTSSAIGRLSDYPREQDVWDIFQGFMQAINDRYVRVAGMDPPFYVFVEEVYLKSEHVRSLSPSTTAEYRRMWKRDLKGGLKGETLGSVRPVKWNALFESIVRERSINKYTIQHVKAFASGIYTWARNHGHFDGANPVVGVKLPKARRKSETYAYDLPEELAIMNVLELKAKAAIAAASFAGLTRSEMQGLRWEDRRNGSLHIVRNVVYGIEKETKTESRSAPVPIIKHLGEILDTYWEECGRPAEGWVWPASRGKLPMDFNNLYRRHILEPMEKAKLTWYGWHAFRRGLASNLSDLGVPDPVIQQVLRHADVTTTEKFYRKVRRPAVTKAMKKLSKQLSVVNESGNRKLMSDKHLTSNLDSL